MKIDVEIDGGTHLQEKVKQIDARRDRFSNERGWEVLRFPAKRVKKDVVGCLKEVDALVAKRLTQVTATHPITGSSPV